MTTQREPTRGPIRDLAILVDETLENHDRRQAENDRVREQFQIDQLTRNAKARAKLDIECGLLTIERGFYKLTERGRYYLAERLQYCLRMRTWGYPPDFLTLVGVAVGREGDYRNTERWQKIWLKAGKVLKFVLTTRERETLGMFTTRSYTEAAIPDLLVVLREMVVKMDAEALR